MPYDGTKTKRNSNSFSDWIACNLFRRRRAVQFKFD
jgi:hypothetical protein